MFDFSGKVLDFGNEDKKKDCCRGTRLNERTDFHGRGKAGENYGDLVAEGNN